MKDPFDSSILQYLPQYEADITNPDSWIKQADELLAVASMLKPVIRKEWETIRTDWEEAQARHKGEDPLPPIPKKIPVPSLLPVKFQRVYFLLTAFAVENICKAAIVRREYPSIKREVWKNRRIPKTLRDHDLIGLIERAQTKLNVDLAEEDLLRRLTRHAVWAGRYPVPQSLAEAKYTEQFRDGRWYGISYFYEDGLDRIETLISKIRGHLGL